MITKQHKLLKARYDELEDENEHRACCELMAAYSKDATAMVYARHCTLIQERLGHHSEPCSHLRIEAYKLAREAVAKAEGEEVAAYLFGAKSSLHYSLGVSITNDVLLSPQPEA